MADLFWCVYPSGQADPTAAEIKNQTVPNGIFGSDTAPTGTTVGFLGTQISGLTPNTSYKLAGVWSDGPNDSNVDITIAFVTPDLPVTDINPVTETVVITTPQVEVVTTLDTIVDPATETLVITAPPVQVLAGPTEVVNVNTATVVIQTPQVDVEVLLFTNVDVNTATVEIITPQVEVEVFKDTFVDPITETLVITAPQVDVDVGIDITVDVNTATIVVSTLGVQVQTPVEFLVATEAEPLAYQVLIGGDVQMTSNPDAAGVLAWRNEHGDITELDPFPAVIQDQPEDVAVTAPAPAVFTVLASGAASYQWYVDDVPQIGETLSTFTINPTVPGTYLVRCVVINSSDIGITSKEATLVAA